MNWLDDFAFLFNLFVFLLPLGLFFSGASKESWRSCFWFQEAWRVGSEWGNDISTPVSLYSRTNQSCPLGLEAANRISNDFTTHKHTLWGWSNILTSLETIWGSSPPLSFKALRLNFLFLQGFQESCGGEESGSRLKYEKLRGVWIAVESNQTVNLWIYGANLRCHEYTTGWILDNQRILSIV